MGPEARHLHLASRDHAASRRFYETYFGFRCVAARGRDALAVLVDESGFILTLNNFDKVTEVSYPGAFHIGFMQDSRERVDEIYQRLKSGGFDMEPPREFHGAWTFYLRAPGGFLVEVGHQHRHDGGRSSPIARGTIAASAPSDRTDPTDRSDRTRRPA